MERLKSVVPESVKRMVADTTNVDNLPSTSSSLLDFFRSLPQFHQVIKDLADPDNALCAKNEDAAFGLKRKGNQLYASGDYAAALASYSQALRAAPIYAVDGDKSLVATLYLNRASLFHKIGLLTECLRDCNRALQISPSYAKAWYRRGKVNASLGNYKDAVHDLNLAKNVELSLGGRRQIESELNVVLDQYKATSSTGVQDFEKNIENTESLEELQQGELLCITTSDKGRGMASQCDIGQASLVHKEEPYVLIISKSCRDTHCHYCLNELPADIVPCVSCSGPLYCSQHCQLQAGGETFNDHKKKGGIDECHFSNLDEYIADGTLCNYSDPTVECFPEHKHECLGAHWPVVLPSDIVLAGRMIVKSMSQQKGILESDLLGTLNLSHNYAQISPESKLEVHIYATVLLYCLQHSLGFELPINGHSLSQTVICISQIRVNSMAVVRMKSADVSCLPIHFGKLSSDGHALTSSVEQVPVGQAIYMVGSLFNHSCRPNIHAYFLSRSLFIRTTEFVAEGCPLELSYGPQVGQWTCQKRLMFLEDKYSFRCQCNGCAEPNFPDLVLNAFHCANANCDGVVLDSSVIECEQNKLQNFSGACKVHRGSPLQEADMLNSVVINDLAPISVKLLNSFGHNLHGCCLKCGFHLDLEASKKALNRAQMSVKSLKDAMGSKEVSSTLLADGSRALWVLRSILHAYNKDLAEAEDILAQAFCLVGDLKSAVEHCKASIEILDMLYGSDHIAIGYELVKLSTIQLSLDDGRAALDSIDRLVAIFMRYYGSHANIIFPYLRALKEEAHNPVE